MTIQTRNDSTSEDNTRRAMPTFKKPLSTSSTSLANGKSYHSKHSHFFVNEYRRNNKHNERSSRHKHWPGDKRKG